MSATTRFQGGGTSGGPMNGMFPSQMAARGGMQQFRKRMNGTNPATDVGGMIPGGPQPSGTTGSPSSLMSSFMTPQAPLAPPSAPLTTTIGDSFLGGKTSLVNTNPADTAGLRGAAAGNLTGRIGSDVSQYTPQISSVDSLGGANSPFFQNMMNQLQPAFDQRRALALAAAKESAGNLTGSGFANTLGTATNRSLGDEQALLADYANKGVGMELDRQKTLAGLNNQASISNADRYAQLLSSFGNSGVGPGQITNQSGAGSLIGPAAGLIGQWLASRGRDGGGGGGGGYGGGGYGGAGGAVEGTESIPGSDNFDPTGVAGGAVSGLPGMAMVQSLAGRIPGLSSLGNGALWGAGAGLAGSAAESALGHGNDLGNILGGAGRGAAIGSVIPGVGTAAGALVGGAVAGIKKLFHW